MGKMIRVDPVIISIALLLLLTQHLLNVAYSQEQIYVVSTVTLPALAVGFDENGTSIGVVTDISVKVIYPGNGRIYVSTEPLSQIDFQAASRVAALLASYYSRVDISRYDILISIDIDSPVIGGPSAGVPLFIAIYSALANKSINKYTAGTGMILPDGLIGPVGGIPEKVRAAIENGYFRVVIPSGQSIYNVVRQVERSIGPIVIVENIPETINVSALARDLGGEIYEAASFRDVIRYFINDEYNNTVYLEPFLISLEKEMLTNMYYSFRDRYLELYSETLNYYDSNKQTIDPRLNTYISQLIDRAENTYNRSLDYYRKNLYMALSYVLNAYIILSYIKDLIKIASMEADDAREYLLGKLESIKENLSEILDRYYSYLDSRNLTLSRLSLLTEIYRRIDDANNSVATALNLIKDRNYVDALYYISYVDGRLVSIDIWFSLLENYDVYDTFYVSYNDLRDLAGWIFSFAKTSSGYATSLAREIGASTEELSRSLEELDKAGELININDFVGSISHSIESIMYSQITIYKIFNLNLSSIAHTLRMETRYTLGDYQNLNYMAPLPLRLYIYAGDDYFSQNDFLNSIEYYELSLILSKLYGFLIVNKMDRAVAQERVPDNDYQEQKEQKGSIQQQEKGRDRNVDSNTITIETPTINTNTETFIDGGIDKAERAVYYYIDLLLLALLIIIPIGAILLKKLF